MKLSQLFSGEVRTDSAASHTSQLTPSQMEQANRQIRSLVPGQTISGEIVSRNGSEVQIRLSDDILLNARVDRNLNLEVGKNMTFEVKNNGSALTLSPLFTNVATDVNVLKALDMAGLPVNRASIEMTEQLMAAGMSVNRNSLQQIFREINAFPQAQVSDIVSLHRLQMPVNEANLNQMISYRNLNHQLTQGMDAILEALPEVFDAMAENGDTAGAIRLYQEVLSLVQEGGMTASEDITGQPGAGLGDLASGDGTVAGELASEGTSGLTGQNAVGEVSGQENILTGVNTGTQTEDGISAAGILQEAMAELENEISLSLAANGEISQNGKEASVTGTGNRTNGAEAGNQAAISEAGRTDAEMTENIPRDLRNAAAGEVLTILDNMHLSSGQAASLRSQLLQFANGQINTQQLFSVFHSLAEEAKFSSESMKLLEKLFSGPKFRTLLSQQLKNNWMLRPEEVASPGKVEEMYRRLDRQLKVLGNALENTGQTEGTAYKAVSSMSQNIDFLNQLNQMYTYVQLPLRLQQRDAQGELYVYTNKKKLTSQDGTVSALLHLDMEHLGPVDVYVSLKNTKVNTRFYLRDDDMIDFMAQHMDVLTQRLEKRGYDCSFSMVRRESGGNETTEGGLEPVLRQNKGIMLSHYAFDVRT